MDVFGKEYKFTNVVSVSQSVIHQILNASSCVVIQVKGLIKIIVKFRAEKILCYSCQHLFEEYKIMCMKTIFWRQ